MDNVMVERLWRTVKYEEIYLRDYADGAGWGPQPGAAGSQRLRSASFRTVLSSRP